ncbi:hypothetical protein MRB53_026862 [Persea americana]|uniref:Uncharacterized protein n=1 Tax=Persea americana TaxID=3435 RepID=A0ACC2LJC0_PERAE|nr:hypothetical protein MRB53_026862 [Persea americana]
MEESKRGEWKPVFAMLAVDVAFAIVNILFKKVLDEGMDHLVLVIYRQAIATVFIAPIAYFKERKTRPKLTARIFWQLFLCALIGATFTQYLSLLGIKYTSATFACAFINMVPVLTFLSALPFGLESADMKSKAGRSKVLGTVVCVGGAMLLTFYKGMALTNTSHSQAMTYTSQTSSPDSREKAHKWTIGSILLLGACLCWCSWFLIQAKIGKAFPAPYSSTTVISFLSCLQSATLSLAIKRDISLWALTGKFRIATVIYAGMVGSGLCYAVMSWCVEKRGPVFTAAFSPVIQIVVAVIDVTLLQEQLHLGSILGSFFVIVGLYILLWGKNLEAKNSIANQAPSMDSNERQSLEQT